MGFEGIVLLIALLHWAEIEECKDWERDWNFWTGCPSENWEPPQDP